MPARCIRWYRRAVRFGEKSAPERTQALGAATVEGLRVAIAEAAEDLTGAGSGSSSVGIFLGNGDGTFQAARYFPAGGGPWLPLPADFNGDGRLDIAVGNFDDGTSILLAH